MASDVLSVYYRQCSNVTVISQMFVMNWENSDTESAEDSENEDSKNEDSLGAGVKTKARCVVC